MCYIRNFTTLGLQARSIVKRAGREKARAEALAVLGGTAQGRLRAEVNGGAKLKNADDRRQLTPTGASVTGCLAAAIVMADPVGDDGAEDEFEGDHRSPTTQRSP